VRRQKLCKQSFGLCEAAQTSVGTVLSCELFFGINKPKVVSIKNLLSCSSQTQSQSQKQSEHKPHNNVQYSESCIFNRLKWLSRSTKKYSLPERCVW